MDGAEANSFVKAHPRTKRGYKEECENEGCDAEEIEEIIEYAARPMPIGGGGGPRWAAWPRGPAWEKKR